MGLRVEDGVDSMLFWVDVVAVGVLVGSEVPRFDDSTVVGVFVVIVVSSAGEAVVGNEVVSV